MIQPKSMCMLTILAILIIFTVHTPPQTINQVSNQPRQSTHAAKQTTNTIMNLTIFFIKDWHGYLEPHLQDEVEYGGAATYMGYFEKAGYFPNADNYLLLSGGDHNTGPAIATLSEGDAMIDVMNQMGFDAAAIGNHEFDYGIEALQRRQNNSTFPLLSCNIHEAGTSKLANFTIPYTILNRSGLRIGLLGVSSQTTATKAHPKFTSGFEFGEYEAAVRTYASQLRADGADLIFALTDLDYYALNSLATNVADLNITAFLGSYRGEGTIMTSPVTIVTTGEYATQYATLCYTLNTTTKQVLTQNISLHDNLAGGVTPNATIQATVEEWRQRIQADEVISYCSTTIDDTYPESGIGNLVTDGFLHYFNFSYNFGTTNRGGGFRDIIKPGNVTLADVAAILAFKNNLMAFNLSGTELWDILQLYHGELVFSGIRYNYSYAPGFRITSVLIQDGEDGTFTELEDNTTYNGLITDYSWWVEFKDDFPAVDTGVHYRDAVLDYWKTLDNLANHSYDHRVQEVEYESPSSSTSSTSFSSTALESTTTTKSQDSNSAIPPVGTPGLQFSLMPCICILLVLVKRRWIKKN